MSYEYQLTVTRYYTQRYVMIGVGSSDLEQASSLSEMSINEITKTLAELNAVISGDLEYLDWGTDLFHVFSEVAVSRYGDFDKVERYEVSTIGLRDFLIELKKFKEQCLAGDDYKAIIGEAFATIKVNPSKYKRWPTSDTHFLITLNNIIFSLVLESNDFNLTQTQYVAQLEREF
ncbi:hypothetical protein [Flavobacterium quisquiliarum]|uniref:Uncharacterized protein n=1 Tax=Flavobacterium quisquiliarum TaxID=1834436 RepID=A0ABV8VZQ8_9FLAO|nr:hypothetical protein [Flavobacterium quisquiliarum]MBW1654581.1 hypothetical protein [Flavobacterium quisquiliarum]NWL01734.1 hypothetical protein [Flavobacterium collinsii]